MMMYDVYVLNSHKDILQSVQSYVKVSKSFRLTGF